MKPHNSIDHIVIIVKENENHAFDNYFDAFPGVNGVTLPQAQDPQPRQQKSGFLMASRFGWRIDD